MNARTFPWGKPSGLLTHAATFALLMSTFAGVVFYAFRVYAAYLYSDAAVANILAGEMLRSGTLFPKDWWYVNNDIWILFKQLPVALYAMVGTNGLRAHAFGILVGTLLLICSSILVLRQGGATFAASAGGTALLCVGLSDAYLEIAFGEGAYTWFTAYILGCVAGIIRLRDTAGASRRAWAGLAVLVFLLAVSNPSRFAAYLLVPICLSLALASREWTSVPRILARMSSYGWGTVMLSLVLVVAIVSHLVLISGLNNLQGASGADLIPLEQLPARFGLALYALLGVLGVDWVQGTRMASLGGLLMLSKLCLLPLLLLLPVEGFLRHDDGPHAFERRLIAGVGCIGMALMTLLTIASTLQGKSSIEAVYTVRYVFPYFQILLLCNALYWHKMDSMRRALLVCTVALILVQSLAHLSPGRLRQQETQEMASNSGFSFRLGWRKEAEKRAQVVAQLAAEGLKVGYAPYWHSHIYTVASGGQVEIRPLHMDDGELRPWLHLSSSRWYKSGYADGQVFLLIPEAGSERVLSGLDGGCTPKPSRTLRIAEYFVQVYDRNPLLASLDSNLDAVGKVCLKTPGLTQNGNYIEASGSLVAPAGVKPGFVRFGPYAVVGRGNYNAKFRIRVDGGGTGFGYVDVVTGEGKSVVGSVSLELGAHQIEIPLHVSENVATGVEFRVYSTGKGSVSVESIELSRSVDAGTNGPDKSSTN